jgi:hypothetical protein
MGLTPKRITDVLNNAESATAKLTNRVSTYESDRLLLANTILQQMQNLATQQNVIDQITARMAQEDQLRQDLAGLRHSIEVQEARYADFMQAFNTAAQLIGSASGTTIEQWTGTLTTTAADAAWPAGSSDPTRGDLIAAFRSRAKLSSDGTEVAWPIAANRGDILNVSTTGSWSPTCALRTSTFTNPITGKVDSFKTPPSSASPPQPLPASLPTGPEGYLATLASGTFSVVSNQSVHSTESYDNVGKSQKACAGLGFSLTESIPIIPNVFSMAGSASFSDTWCQEHDWGTKTSDATSTSASDGSESRMAAAFASGIRVRYTPFPNFPAGSLLLVQVKRNGISRLDISDVQVLQRPSSSIIFRDDADIYLVVNDIVSPECGAPDPGALTLSIKRLRPLGALAKQLGQGMADALARVRGQEELYLQPDFDSTRCREEGNLPVGSVG